MAGSSTYPTSVDNKTQLQDGVDYMEGDNVNNAYVPLNAIETFIGTNGKGQSWTTDILDFLANEAAPILTKASGSTLSLSAGAIFIKNSGQVNRLMRRTTSPTTISAANLDTASMAVGYYDIYVLADSAATTFTVKFCIQGNTPSGATNFEKQGWFYNETAGVLDVTSGFVGNYKINGRDVPNMVTLVDATNFTQTVNATYTAMSNFTARFISSGRPVLIIFRANFTLNATDRQVVFGSHINGTEYKRSSEYAYGSQTTCLIHIETLAAGAYTIDIRHKQGSPAASSITSDTGAGSTPSLMIIEL